MHYFFLEKQSPLTQRWQVRQVAFDSKYRYLYYTKSLSHVDIQEVMTRGHDGDHSPSGSPHSSGGTSSRKVKWSGKVKVTQLRYAADEYMVRPGSADFDERLLLTLVVVGFERPLENFRSGQGRVTSSGNRSLGTPSEKSYSLWSSVSRRRSTSRLSSARLGDSDGDGDDGGCAGGVGGGGGGGGGGDDAHQPLLHNADPEVPDPEAPSGFLHMPSYPVNESLDEDFEDEDENMFRDIDLVPDDDDAEDEEETSLAASEAGSDDGSGDDDDADDAEDVVFNSPPSTPTGSARSSSYSFFSRRRRGAGGAGGGGNVKDEKTVQLHFRAANYDVFRIVSLRVRQALVRHGLCGPLHAGLPPYDPRNGIALATVPLHLRHAFRRLNDVVFYSLQIGHVVYVRQQREVRGMEGYLCITHDSILLLQLDGKCPRWLDLEDIVGVQYVLHSNHSFISIRAAEPYPDFVFIPIIPSYPPNSSFDAEECVEGIVSMVRRLLMQRLRAGEEVALAPVSSRRVSVQTAEETEEYDILCHIHDLSPTYTDVFKYIAQEQSTGAVPLRWRWDNSKTPTHFTFKRDLYHALEREEGEDSEDDDDVALNRSQRRPFVGVGVGAAAHAHLIESLVPSRQQQHLSASGGRLASAVAVSVNRSAIYASAAPRTTAPSASSYATSPPTRSAIARQDSLCSNASFTPATMTQLMAPPSRGAELRAKRRLLVTRTDRRGTGPSDASGTAATASGDRPPHPPLPAPPAISAPAAGTSPRAVTAASGAATAPRVVLTTLPAEAAGATRGASVVASPLPGVRTHGSAVVGASVSPHRERAGQPTQPTAASTRSPSSRPNTYGLVPSHAHTDPAQLDFWLSAAAPPVAPVATAQKGVHLSEIHSSLLAQSPPLVAAGMPTAPSPSHSQPPPPQTSSLSSFGHYQTSSTSVSGSERPSLVPPVNLRGAATVMTATAAATVFGGASAGSGCSSRVSTPAPSGAAAVPAFSSSPHSVSSVPVASSAAPGTTQRAHSSSAGRHDSTTNGSRSPQEVTHTTENMSTGRGDAEEDEESDEDFDSEDMEDMLQRPESRTPPPPAAAAAAVTATAGAGTAGGGSSTLASPSAPRDSVEQGRADNPTTAAAAAGAAAGGAPRERSGTATRTGDNAAFVPVSDGVVTQVVLTAEMLPGYNGHRDEDLRSDAASAPSPSLQARPDMVAFIPPAALPR
ncbi:hypothetical protein NESM_000216100 [Novymonas esmeraldas]|uniref:PH domain-containing protein n=1 Tax=Novymonas esmeraldas TaxID=1808958 RepID=A0AAW0F8B6_9TRYP